MRLGPREIDVRSEEVAFLEGVRDVVDEKMGDCNFRVDDLAAEMGLSTRQLQRRLARPTYRRQHT